VAPWLQVVSSELAGLSHDHTRASEEVTNLRTQLAATEQLLRGKEAEVEDVRHAYEGLAVEHRRVQSTVLQVSPFHILLSLSFCTVLPHICCCWSVCVHSRDTLYRCCCMHSTQQQVL
jgi:hypothetical protein